MLVTRDYLCFYMKILGFKAIWPFEIPGAVVTPFSGSIKTVRG